MRHKLLTKLADFISSKPWWSGLLLLIATVVLGGMAAQLTFTTSITNLMPDEDPMVQEFNKVMDEYAGAASMLVVAEGDEKSLTKFAENVAPQIAVLKEYVKKVDYKLPRELLADHALMLINTSDLKNNQSIFEDPNLTGFLTNLNDSFEKEYIQSDEKISGQEQEEDIIRFLDGIQTFTTILDDALKGSTDNAGKKAADAVLFGDNYYRSWDRQMLIMQIIPTFSFMDIEKDVDATNIIEKIVHESADKFGVSAGLTGSIPLSRDEMVSVENDSFTITLFALLGVMILFFVAFRMFISPILAIITLIFGVIWGMGVAWPIVKQLNLMTSMMSVVLIGLGIDFAIHIISVYTEMRRKGEGVPDSLRYTLQKSGLGIITGGFTTAAAFLTMAISRTEGLKEFGVVLGAGIVMTMIAAITVLPTLLVLHERLMIKIKKNFKIRPKDISYRFLGSTAASIAGKWKISLALILILLLFLGFRGSTITMDYNYLNMEPKGLESIELQDKMIEKLNISSDYAYITAASTEEAHVITEAAKDMSTSGMVQSIVDFLPPEKEQIKRSMLVKKIRNRMKNTPLNKAFSVKDLQMFIEELIRLEMNLIEVQDMAVLGAQDKVYMKAGLLVGFVPEEDDETILSLQEKITKFIPDQHSGMLSMLIQNFDQRTSSILTRIQSFHQEFGTAFKPAVIRMANPEQITLETLPENIKNQYVGKSGDSFLVTVFPKGNVWDFQFLDRFTKELEEISPRSTGLAPVFKRLMDLIGADGKNATILALLVIVALLLADFRSVRKMALAVVPLVIGVVWMLGVMEVTGLQLTLLNIMAIPMIIGIGIDDGVHIIHRYQIEGRTAHKAVFASTGRAVLLTSLTTMLTFGSLWFAVYRGLGSMGIALFIGVGTCFLATILIIPAVMGWVEKRTTN